MDGAYSIALPIPDDILQNLWLSRHVKRKVRGCLRQWSNTSREGRTEGSRASSPHRFRAMVPRSGDGEVEVAHLPGACREDLESLADVVLSFGGRLYLAHSQLLAVSSRHLASLVALWRETAHEGRDTPLSLLPSSEPCTVPDGVSKATSEEFSSFLRRLYRCQQAFEVRRGARRRRSSLPAFPISFHLHASSTAPWLARLDTRPFTAQARRAPPPHAAAQASAATFPPARPRSGTPFPACCSWQTTLA